MTTYDAVYQKLHAIYDAHSRSNHNTDSKQMCCMWSTSTPPDYLVGTSPLCDIEDVFDIGIDEDLAVDFYDMDLDEAAKKIMEMQGG
jgi:hypothetical protein